MNEMSDIMRHIRGYHVLISLVIFLLFMFFILPSESQKSSALGLESSPDTSFLYTGDDLYEIANQYGEAGRQFYIEQRFTFDLVWPLVYGLFLTTALVFLSQFFTNTWLRKLYTLPLLAMGFDYVENIMTSIVMHRYPKETIIIGDLAGSITAAKWTTLSISFVVLVIILFIYSLKRIKKEKHT
jgi:hypothetical protein